MEHNDTYKLLKSRFSTYRENELNFRLYHENVVFYKNNIKITNKENQCSIDNNNQLSLNFINFSRKKDKILIIANDFIKDDRLYTSGFLYRRVKAYQNQGVDVDVISFSKHHTPSIYEFDGIKVIAGYVSELATLLENQSYKAVAIHFFDSDMWSVMKNVQKKHHYCIFIHGYEIRNWSRGINPNTPAQGIESRINRSLALVKLWRDVLNHDQIVSNYVFVSRWIRRAAEEDIGQLFPAHKTCIIHNFIDTGLFSESKKTKANVCDILMIRNFDKFPYATDVALNVLQNLKKNKHWSSLNIRIFGEGANLKNFQTEFKNDTNVKITETYLTQPEMAKEFKKHGIFLIPSRLDSQGVSRDEAMSSGLVPATNSVAAIPEFVDTDCALLAPPEDHENLSKQILQLIKNPKKFLKMSNLAAKRVRAQSGFENTIKKEMAVFKLR